MGGFGGANGPEIIWFFLILGDLSVVRPQLLLRPHARHQQDQEAVPLEPWRSREAEGWEQLEGG